LLQGRAQALLVGDTDVLLGEPLIGPCAEGGSLLLAGAAGRLGDAGGGLLVQAHADAGLLVGRPLLGGLLGAPSVAVLVATGPGPGPVRGQVADGPVGAVLLRPAFLWVGHRYPCCV